MINSMFGLELPLCRIRDQHDSSAKHKGGPICWSRRLLYFLLITLTLVSAPLIASEGNRLAYLDDPFNPYYTGRNFPKLTTPMWVGEEGVEAVIVLAIDDMRGHEKWEQYLRPILARLKQVDGRAPVSIMTCTLDPQHPHLQQWLKEGVSLEAHTIDHPCPLLKDGDFAKAKSTYDRCVDLLHQVPGNKPVAFRMPCCDSLNTLSPRFFAEIFNKTTSLQPANGVPTRRGNFLQIDSSVFNIPTSNDAELPRELVVDADGRDKFLKYVAPGRSYVNFIEDYPYPYVIGRLCWEFPCATPSDWQGQNLNKPNHPKTVDDLKSAIDLTVVKQGVFNFVFHPHGWIKAEQVVELIDHAVSKHGRKVKFLTFQEALKRLNENLLAGQPLRRPGDGGDNGVRLLDVNNDGLMDVVIANDAMQVTRIWSPQNGEWSQLRFPIRLVESPDKDENLPKCDATARFGVVQSDGKASLVPWDLVITAGWHFEGDDWRVVPGLAAGLSRPARTGNSSVPFNGLQLRDLDGDGCCEAIVKDPRRKGVFAWSGDAQGWTRLPFDLPDGLVLSPQDDAALRFVDLDEDGHDDIFYSRDSGSSIFLFDSMARGWSRKVLAARPGDADAVPPVESQGKHNGFWVHSRHLWWQNENTSGMRDLVDRRSFNALLRNVTPGPKSAEASLRSIRTRPGFVVELMAAEPMVMDPIAFAWGPDGRFWVVEMADYPLGTDGKGTPGGRVRFLEDSDEDGKFDQSTVFLEGLGYPTGVMPWRRGVLVTCAPEILYAEDTDGDGRADVRQTLYSGFHEGNQQHRLNGLVWGLDNWVYGANGDSGGRIRSHVSPRWYSKLEAARGQRDGSGNGGGSALPNLQSSRSEVSDREAVNISGRDFRIRPDDGRIDPQTGQTQFGRCRDDWGNWFGCNNANPMYQFVLADHYVRRNPHVAPPDSRINVSAVPGTAPVYPISRTLERFNDPQTANRFTSACSAMIYRDDLLGPHFEGNSFVCEPVHNLIHREVMSPRGVTFTSRRALDEQESEFLASSDNWFRPTMIQTGPDGALWIADMYRLVIEHPEWIPKEWQERLDLRAGHDKGRIYRVYPVGQPPRAIPRLDHLDTAALVAALDSSSGWQRDMAQMMLIWRGDESAVPILKTLLRAAQRPLARLHALATLDGLDSLAADDLLIALGDDHPGVRRHAVRLGESRFASSPVLAAAACKLVTDPDPHVRMQLAYSLGEWRDPQAGTALAHIALHDSGDPYITAAALSSAPMNLDSLTAALFANPDEHNATPAPDLVQKLLAMALGMNDAAALSRLLTFVTTREPGTAMRPEQMATLTAFLDHLDRRNSSLGQLAASAPSSLRAALLRIDEVITAARRTAEEEASQPASRLAAVQLLGRTGENSTDLDTLRGFLAPRVAFDLQEAAVRSLARRRDAAVAPTLMDGWRTHGPSIRSIVLDVLFSREAWTNALLDRVEAQKVPAGELGAAFRQRLIEHPSPIIRERAIKLFGTATAASRAEIIEQYRPATNMPGDVQRGTQVFKKTCANCHKLAGTGHEIGPDLTALTDRSGEAMLVAIFDPNRAVESKYLSYTAATQSGRVVRGILTHETGNSITLVEQEGKQETLLRADIDALECSGKSLMPEGLEKDLSVQDLADLFVYLRASGPPRKQFDGNTPQTVLPEALRGELHLLATHCEIYGTTLVFEGRYGNLGYWSSEDDRAVWKIEVPTTRKYGVWLEWACDDNSAGNSYLIEFGAQSITGTVPGTGNWDTYKRAKIGEIQLSAGTHEVVMRSMGRINGALIDLREIKLLPATR